MTPHPQAPSAPRHATLALAFTLAFTLVLTLGCRPRPREVGPAFQYDLEQYRKSDPALLICKELPPLALPQFQPRAIALAPDGDILVGGDRQILRLDPESGQTRASIPFPSEIRAIAAAASGTIYAASRDSITSLPPQGAPPQQWESLGEHATITSLAAGPDTLWVADAGQRQLLAYDPSGKLLARLGASDGESKFVIPSPHFDTLDAGQRTAWIVNPGRLRLERRDLDDRILESWGTPSMRPEGFTGCCNPTDIARLADGGFVTSEKGIPRIKLHRPDGSLAGLVAGPEAFDPQAQGFDLAVDRQGRILALDINRNVIRRFLRQ